MIAIHHKKGTFSDRWIRFCEKHAISYKIVNCHDDDIIDQLADCTGLMWHHQQSTPQDVQVAKRLLFALEHAGKKVFPNFNTNWHFDDKVAQKYLLEALEAPLVRSYVFYDKKTGLEWARKTTFPKVFKLKGGSGSDNVFLIKSEKKARKIIKKAFGSGFPQINNVAGIKERWRKVRTGKKPFIHVIKGLVRLFWPSQYERVTAREIGYAYFQDFIPDNDSDIRVIIVDRKAFAIKRMIRENDFRASGSGQLSYDPKEINMQCIETSFAVYDKIDAQSIAFDYVFLKGEPLIVEISYGYAIAAYDKCPGYWDRNLCFYEGSFNPQFWMMEQFITEISK